MDSRILARAIEHTLLRAEAVEGDVRRLVAEAVAHRFAAVCVNGRHVGLVASLLREAGVLEGDAPVLPCAVVGFPLGAMRTTVKAMEAIAAMKDGAREIDMVVDLGSLLAGNFEAVRADIFEVVKNARLVRRDAVVKVILETAALTEEQAAMGCRAAREAGADFVKTSTGFHAKGGATEEAVRWLKKYGEGMRVKASGGIRDRAAAERMMASGAERIGTSNGVGIVEGEAGA